MALMTSTAEDFVKVVAGLIYRNGRVLACQRRGDGAFPFKWEFPGGKVEGGEDETAALKRELREELAIEARQLKFLAQHDHAYEGGPAVSLRFYRVSHYAGTPQNLVFRQISWIPLAELASLDFLDGDRPLVARLASPEGFVLLEP